MSAKFFYNLYRNYITSFIAAVLDDSDPDPVRYSASSPSDAEVSLSTEQPSPIQPNSNVQSDQPNSNVQPDQDSIQENSGDAEPSFDPEHVVDLLSKFNGGPPFNPSKWTLLNESPSVRFEHGKFHHLPSVFDDQTRKHMEPGDYTMFRATNLRSG